MSRDNLPKIVRVWLPGRTKTACNKWAKDRGWKKFHLMTAQNGKPGFWVVRGYKKPEEMPEKFHWFPLFEQEFTQFVVVTIGYGKQAEKFRVPKAVAKLFPNNRERMAAAHVDAPIEDTDSAVEEIFEDTEPF